MPSNSLHSQRILWLLATSVGLIMTGFGLILPIFARRLSEFGEGVEMLSMMTMSFAIAQFIASPFMGKLADKIGRKPLILLALISFAVANIGFLFATSAFYFVVVRTLEGLLTAGLFPASMGIVADIAPPQKKAKWAGMIMGAYSIGFIFGPAVGGLLYDQWGFALPFIISAVVALVATLFTLKWIPETLVSSTEQSVLFSFNFSHLLKDALLPQLSRSLLFTLLFVDFILVFAFAFFEPQMIFYYYDVLHWTTTQFGIIVGCYGLAMVVTQFLFGHLSDVVGRKSVIVIGLLLSSTIYIAHLFITSFVVLALISVIAGIGSALIAPALSALYLDITHQKSGSSIIGLKESAAALGSVFGPLLLAQLSGWTTYQDIFLLTSIIILLTTILVIFILVEPSPPILQGDIHSTEPQVIATQAALRGVVLKTKEYE